jgi:hypothetical protein
MNTACPIFFVAQIAVIDPIVPMRGLQTPTELSYEPRSIAARFPPIVTVRAKISAPGTKLFGKGGSGVLVLLY